MLRSFVSRRSMPPSSAFRTSTHPPLCALAFALRQVPSFIVLLLIGVSPYFPPAGSRMIPVGNQNRHGRGVAQGIRAEEKPLFEGMIIRPARLHVHLRGRPWPAVIATSKNTIASGQQ